MQLLRDNLVCKTDKHNPYLFLAPETNANDLQTLWTSSEAETGPEPAPPAEKKEEAPVPSTEAPAAE